MWKSALSLCCLLVMTALPAQAFERPFPPIAKRGALSVGAYPTVTLDGKDRRLSPGAWIRNENNMIDLPTALSGRGELTVNYTENNTGDIDRVWILNAEEARDVPPNQRPENQWANQDRQPQ